MAVRPAQPTGTGLWRALWAMLNNLVFVLEEWRVSEVKQRIRAKIWASVRSFRKMCTAEQLIPSYILLRSRALRIVNTAALQISFGKWELGQVNGPLFTVYNRLNHNQNLNVGIFCMMSLHFWKNCVLMDISFILMEQWQARERTRWEKRGSELSGGQETGMGGEHCRCILDCPGIPLCISRGAHWKSPWVCRCITGDGPVWWGTLSGLVTT